MQRRFHTLDVFTDTRFAGNPLAVVLEPDGLNGEAMQGIAREFNLPETVFVLPPENPTHRAKLRIFTPAAELPFAGHPTVGTAVLLGRIDGASSARRCWRKDRSDPLSRRREGSRRRQRPFRPGAVAAAGETAALPASPPRSVSSSTTSAAVDYVPGVWSAGNSFSMIRCAASTR